MERRSRLSKLPPVMGLILALFLSACAVKKPPSATAIVRQSLPPTTTIPNQWTTLEASSANVEDGWLKAFHDPQMEAVVSEALKNNLDLQAAATRVEVATNMVTEAHAQLLPVVGAAASGGILGRFDQRNAQGKSVGRFNTSSILAGVAWELDIWAKLRSQTAAAREGLAATESTYQWARMSLAATTAKVWYLASFNQVLLKYADQDVKTAQQVLDITAAQFKVGKVEEQQLAMAEAQLAQNRAQQIKISNTYLQTVRGLEVLLGRYPSAELQTETQLAELPPPVPAGLPSRLLERRPDITAAEHNFNSAFHLVQTAQAARLPSFSLSGGSGYATNDLTQTLALRPWVWEAALNIAAPIYNGGYLKAQVNIANQNQKAALALYGQAALQAFKEVEVALTNERNLRDENEQAAEAMKDSQEALNLALVKYNVGQTDLSPVLQIQYMTVGTQMASASVQYELIANRVSLYLALGGSF